MRAPDKPGITNLIDMLAVARGVTAPEAVEREFEGQGYGALKTAVGDALVELLAPVRERYAELRPDEAALEATLAAGAERAREIAYRDDGRGARRGMGDARPSGRAKAAPCNADHKDMKALDRPLVRPLLVVLALALVWTLALTRLTSAVRL